MNSECRFKLYWSPYYVIIIAFVVCLIVILTKLYFLPNPLDIKDRHSPKLSPVLARALNIQEEEERFWLPSGGSGDGLLYIKWRIIPDRNLLQPFLKGQKVESGMRWVGLSEFHEAGMFRNALNQDVQGSKLLLEIFSPNESFFAIENLFVHENSMIYMGFWIVQPEHGVLYYVFRKR